MNREVHVRFWEGLAVRFRWATQLPRIFHGDDRAVTLQAVQKDLPARPHSSLRRRVCERLIAVSLSFRAAARSRVTASASRITQARVPHLPNRWGRPKADGEDYLKFLSGEA